MADDMVSQPYTISLLCYFRLVSEGLKFGRQRKTKQSKEELSEEEQKRFFAEGEHFAKELSQKLNNEAGILILVIVHACMCMHAYTCMHVCIYF